MASVYVPKYGEEAFYTEIIPNTQCFDSDGLQVQSEKDTLTFKSVLAIFENCREYESPENCRTEEETNDFWANNLFIPIVALTNKQVVIKDMENPL